MADAMDMFCQGADGDMFDRDGTPWPEADVTIVDLATFAREGYGAQLSIAYISLINTVKSIMGVDLERMVPLPRVGNASTNGGYCGPAVKPIALHMVAALARDEATRGIPISGIGGISTWRDAAEFIALGSTSVQVCTAVMHYGYRIVEDLIEGEARRDPSMRDGRERGDMLGQENSRRQDVAHDADGRARVEHAPHPGSRMVADETANLGLASRYWIALKGNENLAIVIA